MTSDAFRDLVAEHLPSAAASGRRLAVPIWRRRSADLLTPVGAFLALREAGTFGFLLESVEGGERLARYSFLGKNPYLVVENRGARAMLHRPAGGYTGDGAPHGVEPVQASAFDALGDVLDGVHQ
ncbi:MAG TPA: anthranilate synthase component I, partial [Bacteroidetes bacterium]|nr:anthranilate synthase component I [Bacteroidota bacterium]